MWHQIEIGLRSKITAELAMTGPIEVGWTNRQFLSFELYADDIGQWLQNSKLLNNRNCYIFNFGWSKTETISTPQIMMNMNIKVNLKQMWMESPGNCFIVLVGVKYFQVVDQIEKKVEEIQNQVSFTKIEKMFFFEKSDDILPIFKTFKMPKVR